MRFKKVLLVGNPNVGKSALFSRLTSAKVIISNYPGSTVEFTEGRIQIGDETISVIDVPGTYSMTPDTKAEEVALKMVDKETLIVNVVDATNLERNLNLTLQLKEAGLPIIIALNMWDDTKHRGITIDTEALEKGLGVPVVPTCGLTGEGVKRLIERFEEASPGRAHVIPESERWKNIGNIVSNAQKLTHKHHTFLETLEDMSIRPLSGAIFAVIMLFLSFTAVRTIAETLINYVFNPIFDLIWLPVMKWLSAVLGADSFLHSLLIGNLINGKIDFEMSFGMLTTGLYIQLAAILPYIFSFYLILSLLEDLGYLPRLAVLVDNIMHKIGLHGYAIIPVILSLGCKVPGIMATRILEGRREKFIASALVAMAVPCMSQIAMIIGLVGERGGQYLAIVFGTLFSLIIIKGLILNKFLKGTSPEILVEIPPYRMPHFPSVARKVWIRVLGYLKDAVPYVLLGVLIVNLLYMSRMIDAIAGVFSPLITKLWGLPKEAVGSLLIGVLRKDVAVALLAPLNLTNKQLVIGATVLAIYFPCIATFVVLLREMGPKDMLKITGLMILVATLVGMGLNILM